MSGAFGNQVVMVTGGTRGIGLATARKFVEEGAKVIVSSSQQRNVDEATDELRGIGGDVLGVACDMGDPIGIDDLFVASRERFGHLDVCVCDAAVCPWTMVSDITVEEIDRTMGINVRGLFLVSQKAAAMMREQGSGALVHVGSMAGFCADPEGGLATYCASKAAVHLLTRSLAAELGPVGIRVNGVAPGWIATDMNAEVRADAELMAKYLEVIPLGRFGEPREVADLIAFLASEDAAFVNGAVLLIDGGNMSI